MSVNVVLIHTMYNAVVYIQNVNIKKILKKKTKSRLCCPGMVNI